MNCYHYKVLYHKRAEKFLISNKVMGLKFFKAFQELTENKDNVKKYDIKKFRCNNDYSYRLRIGSYRALFEVHKDTIIVLVLNIDSRGDIYKT